MLDVWHPVAELRQPCLVKAASEHAVDDDGVVRDAVLKSIDKTLWEHVECALFASNIPPCDPWHELTNDKWLTTSALQKTIRRGDSDLAERYVRSSILIDADHTFRRLAIIALEDVGLGDLALTASTQAILGDKRRRQRIGEERLAAYLAVQLARAVKSRLACEMLSLIEYDPEAAKISEPLIGLSAEALSQIVESEEIGYTLQLISLWLLHGTDRFRSRQLLPIAGSGHRKLLRLLTTQRTPLIFHYIVRMGLSRCRDSLAIPYVVLGKFAGQNPLLETVRSDIPKPNFIGDYPDFAYDMHTRIGRRAIRKFEVNCTEQLRSTGVRDVGNLVFALEGGILNERLTGCGVGDIAETAVGLELFGRDRSFSISCDLRAALISTLNEIRRQVASLA